MFTKDHFSLREQEQVEQFILERSFGILATHFEEQMFSSPLPCDLRRDDAGELFVTGHVATNNILLQAVKAGSQATLTVMGPDSFIPADWFGTRSRIPTWLYCAVEITGRLELVDDAMMVADLDVMMDRLQLNATPETKWTISQVPDHLVKEYLGYITGFRLRDLTIKSCFRLNQGLGNAESLIENLRNCDSDATRQLADLVETPPTKPSARAANDTAH